MRKILKSFVCIVLVLTMLNVSSYSTYAANVKHYKKYNSIVVTGIIPLERLSNYVSRSISVHLLQGEKTIYIDEVPINNDGTYQIGIYFKNGVQIEDCKLRLRVGNESVVDTVGNSIASYTELIAVPAKINRNGKSVTVTLDCSTIDVAARSYMILAGVYSAEGAMKKCVFLSDKKLQQGKDGKVATYELGNIEVDDTVKFFIWQDFQTLMPVAYLSDDEITFGEQYKENVSYNPLSDASVYDRYNAAKNESIEKVKIPEEPDIHSKHILYVSSTGDDNNTGSEQAPFKTVEKALSVIAGWSYDKKSEWKTICIKDGIYNVEQKIIINQNICDSNNNANLVIKAMDGAEVTFTSSKIISGNMMKKVSDLPESEKNRFNTKALDNIYYCDYSDIGLNEVKITDLIHKENVAIVSRYPNASNVYISEVINSGSDGTSPVFVPSNDRFKTWENPDDKIGIEGQLVCSWVNKRGFVQSIDKENGTITLPGGTWTSTSTTTGITNGIGTELYDNNNIKSHYYFYNILEELDMETEWCAEDKYQRLYYYPINGVIDDSDILYLTNQSNCETIFEIDQVNNVIFDGIDFSGGDKAIYILGCKNLTINNAKIKNFKTGLYIYNSVKSGIINSYIENVDSGVRLVDSKANIYNLESDRNFVCNVHMNNIRNNGVFIDGGVGNIISNNLAENYKESFVYIWRGCENIIEYNESVAGAQLGYDGGSIYNAGQFDSRHNHIRYNYIHHNNLEAEHNEFDNTKKNDISYINEFIAKNLNADGIRVDDMGEAQYIYGNIFECLSTGVGINSGDDIVVDDNTFVNCIIGTSIRGPYSNKYNNMFYKQISGRYGFNVDMTKSPILAGYFDANYNLNESSAYQSRYSYLSEKIDWCSKIKDKWSDSNFDEDIYFFASETGNLILDNDYSNCMKPEIYSELAQTHMDTSVDVKSGEKPTKYNGYSWLQYNVVYGNETDSTKVANDSDIYHEIGVGDFDPNIYNVSDSDIKVLYEEENASGGSDIVWLSRNDANYYKVTLTNSSGTKTVYTFNNKLITDTPVDSYIIEAYTYRKDSNTTQPLAKSLGKVNY